MADIKFRHLILSTLLSLPIYERTYATDCDITNDQKQTWLPKIFTKLTTQRDVYLNDCDRTVFKQLDDHYRDVGLSDSQYRARVSDGRKTRSQLSPLIIESGSDQQVFSYEKNAPDISILPGYKTVN